MKRTLVGGLTAVALVGALTAANQLGATASPNQQPAGRTFATIDGSVRGLGFDFQAAAKAGKVSEPRTFGAMKTMRSPMRAPASADLSQYAVTPGNQGRVGSCVAWATGYTGYGILMNQQKIPGGPMHPMYIYAQIAQGNDQGTFAAKALPMLQQQGIDTKAHYSHDDEDYTSQPNQAERANAAKYKLSGYKALPTSGDAAKQAIMEAISSGSPVPIGMRLRSNFNDMDAQTAANYSYRPSGGVIGGHEITIVGYNDKGVKLQNSWGTGWGDGGFFTLPWDFVNWGDLDEAHSMGQVVGGNPRPTPGPDNPTTRPTVRPTNDPTAPPRPRPTDPNPYPTQPDPYPTQPDPYPTDPNPYPTQPDPYPTDPNPYPTDPNPYPTDGGDFPDCPPDDYNCWIYGSINAAQKIHKAVNQARG